VRQHEQQERVAVGVLPRTAAGAAGVDRLHRDDEAELADHGGGEGPAGDPARGAEPDAAQPQSRAVPEADPPQRYEQDQRLQHHAQGRRTGENGDLPGGPAARRVRVAPGGLADGAEHDEQADDRHHVVHDRGPHVRAEATGRVQHLAEHRVDAVEEDLRQAPDRERDAQVAGGGVPGH
jgi:hypothetical protein